MLLKRLYKYYLLLVFVLCYLLFYLPVWYVLIIRKDLKLGHRLRRSCARVMFFLSAISIEVIQQEKIDHNKTYIICANHDSYLDIPSIVKAVPGYLGFMGKAELADNPFAKIFFRTLDIAVERENSVRSATSYKKAVNALHQGRSLVIFPEGGIFDKADKISPFKDGAFQLAVRQQVEILPVILPDNGKAFPVENIAKPGKIRLILHKPVAPGHDAGALKQQVYELIQQELINSRK